MEAPAPPVPAFDWSNLFRAAGLDPAGFQAAEPQWTPLANWDSRAAWTGADQPTGAALRVEAAAWRGRPVFFRIIGPWNKPERTQPASRGTDQLWVLAVVYAALISAGLIAWRHLRSGKGDRRGAFKLGFFYFVCLAGGESLATHHTTTLGELTIFWKTFSTALINAGVVWAFYLALEPWVRRSWPRTLISWSRAMAHGIGDALVGRDFLYGAGLGCALAGLKLAALALHGSAGEPVMPPLSTLLGARLAMTGLFQSAAGALFDAMLFFFILFVARVVLRKQWIAAAVFVLILTALFSTGTVYPRTDIPLNLLGAGVFTFVLLRFGLLALIATDLMTSLLTDVPRTLDFSAWYAGTGMAPLVLAALIAVYAFRTSLGGRPLLKDDAI
ncbi:MAG TPA: hypothetical protein VE959_03665 [Bryobacteraceae bacterium]|nr:hypothetical protein [Bryobacteraceae bacterium]